MRSFAYLSMSSLPTTRVERGWQEILPLLMKVRLVVFGRNTDGAASETPFSFLLSRLVIIQGSCQARIPEAKIAPSSCLPHDTPK